MLLPPALGFSPHPPVSVYGTGSHKTIAAFLDSGSALFATCIRSASRFVFIQGVCLLTHSPLAPDFPFPARAPSAVSPQFCSWEVQESKPVVHRLRLKPRLRSRLTRGRSALPRKPWIFGHEDSHFILATHSGILSSIQSTAPCRYCFIPYAMLLYQSHLCVIPELRCGVSAPDIFGAGPLD